MTTEFPQSVPGPSVQERAIALAGLLAESGIQRIELRSASETSSHAARVTDLPGLLTACVPCHVHGFVHNGVSPTIIYLFGSDAALRVTA
jgi:hypothetical protein